MNRKDYERIVVVFTLFVLVFVQNEMYFPILLWHNEEQIKISEHFIQEQRQRAWNVFGYSINNQKLRSWNSVEDYLSQIYVVELWLW